MSIYDDPAAYARKVRITERLSRIWCEYQVKITEEHEAAKRCPSCGKHTLEYEGGSYEESISPYIYCSNDEIPAVDEDGEKYFFECDYSADFDNEKHEAIPIDYTYDHILAMNCGGMNGVKELGGLQAWFAYAKCYIEGLSTVNRFVIQDTVTGKYLLRVDSGIDHPYKDVCTAQEATVWSSLEHVAYVLWWYVDMHREYRIVNLDTKEIFIKDKQRGIPHVMTISN
ncbi:hypothetical protein [Paenibacillus polymyxa]|uniref:hypothetical protein n=1 Tax=Paenibacillus polymyxa TaxID=1406 RepID=UPI00287FDFF4|nr:hypothetical protein [Paenibacillus polymyxa]